ncbi:hypothetical protein GH714_040701 [Hevea brasiliensis]|uniref:SGNH hydrolase-type esterase domain-containing protein n=1 Tax=Hevea brasiliensis TaxID=3981 RepID=A0A6A6MUB7_HEVBR|nr:hypothetical protein GH714_040701 [Hevea brasiliensis]
MRPQIVLFGDSITQQSFRSGGWGASLADTYSRKADVVVRGYGGYNTRWALFLLHHLFPLVGFISFLGFSFCINLVLWNSKECSPATLIVLITPPPIDEEGRKQYAISVYGEKATELPERTNEMAGVYARQCVELAKDLGIRSIDIWSAMQEAEGWQKKFLSDGLHLTPEGNAVVYQEVIRVFNDAWLSAEEMPYDFPHHSEIDGKNPEKAFQQRCI